MANIDVDSGSAELALAFQLPGLEEIPGRTILTRLNYYDGKFLRADDLRLEQDYVRRLAELDARAGGSGLVYGFDVSLGSGDGLTIGGGLGFDGHGRVLYMPAAFPVGLQKLIDATANALVVERRAAFGSSGFAVCPPEKAAPTPQAPSGAEFYLITIAHAEEACGEEDVFGTLCDDGCASTTDRAYVYEGVVVRARPFLPRTPFVSAAGLTEAHVRSQLVSAYFTDEKDVVPCQISKAGLLSGLWCHGAAAPSGSEVAIAVVGRLSSSTFVDEWVVRRERMETPPRRYWQGRMCMRPWNVFLAQVLQFQCQLPSVLSGRGGDATAGDPCGDHTRVIKQVSSYVTELAAAVAQDTKEAPAQEHAAGGDPADVALQVPAALRLDTIKELQSRMAAVLRKAKLPSQQILIDGGLVELPPAGYLPVTIGTTPTVDEQVRRLMGPGVDLRFCVASHDYVPRAFESAQHMDRISLVEGLADPAREPKVDVIVPDGQIGGTAAKPARGWDATLGSEAFSGVQVDHAAVGATLIHGVARSAETAAGGAELEFAGRWETDGKVGARKLAGYGAATCDANPFALDLNAPFTVNAEAALYSPPAKDGLDDGLHATGSGGRYTATAALKVVNRQVIAAGVEVELSGTLSWSGTELDGDVQHYDSFQLTLLFAIRAAGCTVQVTISDGQKSERYLAELTEDAQVFSAQNAVHLEAQQALKELADGLHDPSYTDARAAKLFDPTASAARTDGLTATLDWVLFHRRREQDCVVVPTRQTTQAHRVFQAFVDQPQGVKFVIRAVENDSPDMVNRYGMREVGVVEFADGSASVTTPTATVRAEWNAVQHGDVIAYAAAGTALGGPSDALLASRIEAYKQVVQQTPLPIAEPVLFRHPQFQSLPGAPDGQIVFITTLQTVDYRVYAAWHTDADEAPWKILHEKHDLAAFLASAQAPVDLGTVSFATGTDDAVQDDLTSLVSQKLATRVWPAFVVSRPGAAAQPVKQQVSRIILQTGGEVPPADLIDQFDAADAWTHDQDHVAVLLVNQGNGG